MAKSFDKFFKEKPSIIKEEVDIDPLTGEVLNPDDNRPKFPVFEKLPLVLSPKLYNFLLNMESGVARSFVRAHQKGYPFDITFIDMEDGDMFSFFPVKKLGYLAKKEGINTSNSDFLNDENSIFWKSTIRQKQKIGGVVMKLFEDFYDGNDVESFINEFKMKLAYGKEFEKFKIVYGEDIRKWYNKKYIDPEGKGGSPIDKSCMNSEEKLKFLDIYVENPDKIGLLIYFDDTGRQVRGRALIWKNLRKPKGRWLMDRIYTTKDHHVNLFIAYAKMNNWLWKPSQTANETTFMDGNIRHAITLSTQLKEKEYRYYPYLDTMYYYTPATGRLASKEGNNIGRKQLQLRSAGGDAQILRNG